MKHLCLVLLAFSSCSGCATKELYTYCGRIPSHVEGFRQAVRQGDKIMIGYDVSLLKWRPAKDVHGVRWTAVIDLSKEVEDMSVAVSGIRMPGPDDTKPAISVRHKDLFASSEIEGEDVPVRYTPSSRAADFSKHDDTYAIYGGGEWFYLLMRDPADDGRVREYRYYEAAGDGAIRWWRPLVYPLYPFTLVWDVAT